MHLFISCPPKLEALLTQELNHLNIAARLWPRGASAPLSMENVYRINMESRIATRVLWPLAHFTCLDRETLYDEVMKINWDEWMSVDTTFAVDANVTDNEGFRHSHFAALVVKDAICDYFRNKTGNRPSVDLQNPAVQFNLFIFKDQATLSFDTSGMPLFKRGYRGGVIQAPLQETLASALLKLGNYQPSDVLCDPFCGSGTILWEAAMMSTKTPAGVFRKSWGFFKHPQFSQSAWDDYVTSLKEKTTALPSFSIFGSDRDLKVIDICRKTQTLTQLSPDIQHSDIRFLRLPVIPNLVVTNPPYGVRLHSATDPYAALASFLQTTCEGKSDAVILSPLRRLPAKFPGRFAGLIPIVSGGLDLFAHLLAAEGSLRFASSSELTRSSPSEESTSRKKPYRENFTTDESSMFSSKDSFKKPFRAKPRFDQDGSNRQELRAPSRFKEKSFRPKNGSFNENFNRQDAQVPSRFEDRPFRSKNRFSNDDFNSQGSSAPARFSHRPFRPKNRSFNENFNRQDSQEPSRFSDKPFRPKHRFSNDDFTQQESGAPSRFGNRPFRPKNRSSNADFNRPGSSASSQFGDKSFRPKNRFSSEGFYRQEPNSSRFGDRPFRQNNRSFSEDSHQENTRSFSRFTERSFKPDSRNFARQELSSDRSFGRKPFRRQERSFERHPNQNRVHKQDSFHKQTDTSSSYEHED